MRKLFFVSLMLAACSSNSSPMTGDDDVPPGDDDGNPGTTEPSAADIQQDYDDVANTIGSNLVAGDFAAQIDAINMVYGRMPAGFTQTQTPSYLLLDGTRAGVVVEYKLYCRDAAATNVACDGLEFEGHVRPTYSGDVESGTTSMDGVQRTAAWVIKNISLPTPAITGSGTVSFASHLATGDYTITATDTLDKVAFQSTPVGPIGGQITSSLTIDRNRAGVEPADRSFTVAATVKFLGTDNAMITLDGTENYTFTLSTGTIAHN